MSDLATLFSAGNKVDLWSAECENATARLDSFVDATVGRGITYNELTA